MSSHPELFHLRILKSCQRFANDVALVGCSLFSCTHFFQIEAETGEALTFADIRLKSYQLAEFLKNNYDLKAGEVLVCFMPNDVWYPIVFLAGAILGCSLTGVSPESTSGIRSLSFKCSLFFFG